jgi:ethanolaminephosphotransferase
MTARRGRHGTLSSALLLAANILIPVAILTFATGFFPYKPLLPGLATYDTVTEYGAPPSTPFDKVVFMVIDALRRYCPSSIPLCVACLLADSELTFVLPNSDFVYTKNSGFEFTQSLASLFFRDLEPRARAD